MKGPVKKGSKTSLWPGRLEAASICCGALVVAGLALESGPDIWARLRSHIPLPRSLDGEALVTVGVFGEVAVGLFIARSAKRQEIESAMRIAELNAETEHLRLLLSYRSLGDTASFVEALRPLAGTVFIIESTPDSREVASLRLQLVAALTEAGWIRRPFVRHSLLDMGLVVHTVVEPDSPQNYEAAAALAKQLHERRVAVLCGVTTSALLAPGTVIVRIGIKPETLEQQNSIRAIFESELQPVTPPQA